MVLFLLVCVAGASEPPEGAARHIRGPMSESWTETITVGPRRGGPVLACEAGGVRLHVQRDPSSPSPRSGTHRGCAATADGITYAYASTEGLQLCDEAGCLEIADKEAPVAFDSSAKHLLTYKHPGEFSVRSVPDGALEWQVSQPGCGSRVGALVDPERAWVGCSGQNAGVWELSADGAHPLPVGQIREMAVSPDGRSVAMAGEELTIWDASDAAISHSRGPASDVVWLEDNTLLAVRDREIGATHWTVTRLERTEEWTVADQSPLEDWGHLWRGRNAFFLGRSGVFQRLHGTAAVDSPISPMVALDITPDARWILVRAGGELSLMTQGGRIRRTWPVDGRMYGAVISSNGRWVATNAVFEIQVWNARTGELSFSDTLWRTHGALGRPEGHDARIAGYEVSDAGVLWVWTTRGGVLRIDETTSDSWQMSHRKATGILLTDERALVVTPAGLFKIDGDEVQTEVLDPPPMDRTKAVLSPDAENLAYHSERGVEIVELATGLRRTTAVPPGHSWDARWERERAIRHSDLDLLAWTPRGFSFWHRDSGLWHLQDVEDAPLKHIHPLVEEMNYGGVATFEQMMAGQSDGSLVFWDLY